MHVEQQETDAGTEVVQVSPQQAQKRSLTKILPTTAL
jgi:hypothetical protein